MIKLEPYTAEFEEEYWNTVSNFIKPHTQAAIMESCRRFLPGFFPEDMKNPFRELVLLPYSRLKEAHALLKNTHDSPNAAEMRRECFYIRRSKKQRRAKYNKLYQAYKDIADSRKDGVSMRVRIVKNSGLTVCPYCNRDYINCREQHQSGAQLDHFFSRSSYPIFSVCLYNLIPVCGNCNRLKSSKNAPFASPFDDEIDWEDITFSYEMDSIDSVRIIITSHGPVKTNISGMHIQEAYQIHDTDVKELLEQQRIYSRTQQEELKNVLHHQISDKEIKQAIFGPPITAKMMRQKSLGKMMSDLHKQLGIYP